MAMQDEPENFFQKEAELEQDNGDRTTYINRELIFSNDYERAISSLNENPKCTRIIIRAARKMLEHHHGDSYEDLCFIDSNTNKYLTQKHYRVNIREVKPTRKMVRMTEDNPFIISVHNHPTNGFPSPSDFRSCAILGYKYGLIVCHNGSIYMYSVRKDYNSVNAEAAINIAEKEEGKLAGLAFDMEAFKAQHEKNMKEFQSLLSDAGVTFKEVLWYVDKRN